MTAIEVRRAGTRFRTDTGWLVSRHSFSFGAFYDPGNTGFGLLVAHNDDVVAPGTGFEPHPHQDMEIVTWVLSGALVHRDSAGHGGVIHPGLAQRMTAGSGIVHSERNDGPDPVRFVQMWVLPDTPGLPPAYQQDEVDLSTGELIPVASGGSAGAVRINQRDATLHAARLQAGGSVTLPAAPHLHLFVAEGLVSLEGIGDLDTGDAARITAADGQRVTAGPAGAEVLVWAMA